MSSRQNVHDQYNPAQKFRLIFFLLSPAGRLQSLRERFSLSPPLLMTGRAERLTQHPRILRTQEGTTWRMHARRATCTTRLFRVVGKTHVHASDVLSLLPRNSAQSRNGTRPPDKIRMHIAEILPRGCVRTNTHACAYIDSGRRMQIDSERERDRQTGKQTVYVEGSEDT